MIVCLCEALSEKALRRAVRETACSTRRELSKATGAGTHCGQCRCDLREIVQTEISSMDDDEGIELYAMAAK